MSATIQLVAAQIYFATLVLQYVPRDESFTEQAPGPPRPIRDYRYQEVVAYPSICFAGRAIGLLSWMGAVPPSSIDNSTRKHLKGDAMASESIVQEGLNDPMPITQERNLFRELAYWMVGFGFTVGLLFPAFVTLLGVSGEIAFSMRFYVATSVAGLVVGGFNFGLARYVIQPRLRLLSHRMNKVADNISKATYSTDRYECDSETCRVTVDSHDELGECARSFNDLIDALISAQEVETAAGAFTKALATHLEVPPLAEQALALLQKYTGATAGAVLVEQEGKLVNVAQHGLTEAAQLANSDHVRVALKTLECQRIGFPEDIAIDGLLANLQPRELIVLPVNYKELVLGAIVVANTRAFTDDGLRLLELFRQSFGLALHNAVTHDRMQRMAAIDPLTGTYNRRFGMTRLREEFNRAQRTNTPLGILMYDIDHFKNVNDSYGHLIGDRVLSRVAGASQTALREGDILVRYGGEEFLIILPGASKQNSCEVAERLRRVVEDTSTIDGEQRISATVSVGVTAYPETQAADVMELIRVADSALYTAKANGRNQVVGNR